MKFLHKKLSRNRQAINNRISTLNMN
ncbi:hypothetical protein KC929_01340 [Patescibacteria group bacterium]|nr:hypothetical protein [Patescibacteria group bacterium]